MARKGFLLPTLILGPADVNRTLVEMQQLDDYLLQTYKKVPDEIKLPKTSRTLEALAEVNDADLLALEDRQRLQAFLVSLQQHAPVLHISFAAEPSAAFTSRIVGWLRANVSKYVLLQVGLQPSIAAGCVLRGTNKVFDMSLRRYLQDQKPLMAQLMAKVREAPEAVLADAPEAAK
jgi:F0F1-type ATP synthase delta subunit